MTVSRNGNTITITADDEAILEQIKTLCDMIIEGKEALIIPVDWIKWLIARGLGRKII